MPEGLSDNALRTLSDNLAEPELRQPEHGEATVLHQHALERRGMCFLQRRYHDFGGRWFGFVLNRLEFTSLLGDLGVDMQVAMDLFDPFEVGFG